MTHEITETKQPEHASSGREEIIASVISSIERDIQAGHYTLSKLLENVVLPGHSFNPESVLGKIKTSLHHVRSAIEKAISEGKRVLYLPGSYDLLHYGHVGYIKECIQRFAEANGIDRSNIFVVVLVDDDGIIRDNKRDKKQGEPDMRPVKRIEQRLVDLGMLPDVDCIGYVPSSLIYDPYLRDFVNEYNPTILETLNNTRYSDMAENHKTALQKAFNAFTQHTVDERTLEKKTDKQEEVPSQQLQPIRIPIQVLQLYVHFLLTGNAPASDHSVTKESHITRMVSIHDPDYLDQVRFLMELVGIMVEVVNDTHHCSTTGIIQNFLSKISQLQIQLKKNTEQPIPSWDTLKEILNEEIKEGSESILRQYLETIERVKRLINSQSGEQ